MLLLPVEGCAPDFSEVWPRDWVSLEGPPRLGIVERGGEVEELLLLLPLLLLVLLLELSFKHASGQGEVPEERMYAITPPVMQGEIKSDSLREFTVVQGSQGQTFNYVISAFINEVALNIFLNGLIKQLNAQEFQTGKEVMKHKRKCNSFQQWPTI